MTKTKRSGMACELSDWLHQMLNFSGDFFGWWGGRETTEGTTVDALLDVIKEFIL